MTLRYRTFALTQRGASVIVRGGDGDLAGGIIKLSERERRTVSWRERGGVVFVLPPLVQASSVSV